MKIGIFLSAAIVVLFVMLLLLNRGEPATKPTAETGPDQLKLIALPGGASSVFKPARPEANGDALWHKALGHFDGHAQTLTSLPVPESAAKAWADLIAAAAEAGQVSERFLDQDTPLRAAAMGKHCDALQHAPVVVLTYGQTLFDQGKKEQAISLAREIWALGYHTYTRNLRLRERFLGLWCLANASDALKSWLEGDEAVDMEKMDRQINDANKRFEGKFKLLMTVDPNRGDVIRLANHDEDPSFRAEAMLKLGVLKFNPGNKANEKLMMQTFAAGKADKNPHVAAAAAAAEALTLEEMKRMR